MLWNPELQNSKTEDKEKLTQLQVDLENEKTKSQDLQTKLSELLIQQPHVVGDGVPVKPGIVSEGQLPDVNPAAVSVVKKDSLGKQFYQENYGGILYK